MRHLHCKTIFFALTLIATSFAHAEPQSTSLDAIKFSVEAEARWVTGNTKSNGGQIDSTELGALAEFSKGVRFKGLLAFQNLCIVDQSKGACPKDWQRFLRESYIEFDLNEMIPNGPHTVILVGRMMVEASPLESGLMLDTMSPVFSQTRVRTAYAIQVVVDTKKTGLVDEVAVAAINTGPNDDDIQRAGVSKNASGGMIRLTKTIFDRLTLTLGLMQIDYRPKKQTRFNMGAAYAITSEWKVFLTTSTTNFDPYNENSKHVISTGFAFDGKKGTGGIEVSHVDKQYTQFAAGYLWKMTPTIASGFEARYNQCDRGGHGDRIATECAKNNSRITFETRYQYDAISKGEEASKVTPEHCAVGDPGCVPEAKPYQNEKLPKN
jgi:hypothetical protein